MGDRCDTSNALSNYKIKDADEIKRKMYNHSHFTIINLCIVAFSTFYLF